MSRKANKIRIEQELEFVDRICEYIENGESKEDIKHMILSKDMHTESRINIIDAIAMSNKYQEYEELINIMDPRFEIGIDTKILHKCLHKQNNIEHLLFILKYTTDNCLYQNVPFHAAIAVYTNSDDVSYKNSMLLFIEELIEREIISYGSPYGPFGYIADYMIEEGLHKLDQFKKYNFQFMSISSLITQIGHHDYDKVEFIIGHVKDINEAIDHGASDDEGNEGAELHSALWYARHVYRPGPEIIELLTTSGAVEI